MAITPPKFQRPAAKIAPKAAPAPVVEDIEEEETQEEEVAAPVAAKAVVKTKVAAPVAAKATVKTKVAAPVVAKTVAKAAVAKAAAPAAAKKASLDAPAKGRFEVVLPEVGTRINQAEYQDLYFQFLKNNLDIEINNKSTAVKLFNATMQFLFNELGDRAEDVTVEEIATNGGLLKYFQAQLFAGVTFKHQTVTERFFKNPHESAEPGSGSVINGRTYIKLSSIAVNGTSVAGISPDGTLESFVENE
jgi:hypothetical protein